MEWVGKKYKLDKSEGFEDYMKALGKGIISISHLSSINDRSLEIQVSAFYFIWKHVICWVKKYRLFSRR